MSDILVIAEHDGTTLNQSTARCVSCAAGITGATVRVAVLAADPAGVAAQAANLKGVSEVLTVSNPANAHSLAAVIAPQVVALAADHTHVFGPSSSFGKDLMPRVAGLLGVSQISNVMEAESARRFKRPIYAGTAVATVECDSSTKIVATVRLASFEPVASDGCATIRSVANTAVLPNHTRFRGIRSGNTDRPDLQTASRVVSAGRAIGSAENFKMIYGIAERMGAAVGASRAAVDAGYAPNELQVGQTGKIIAPDLYVAIGISGAIQHLTGIKDARTIVAINKDAEAPIFEIADLGLVGDLFQILPEMDRLLAK
jgi:electron transfer flavoprotein alpha subunit